MDKRQNELIKVVTDILKRFLKPATIIIFGSRAKKNNELHSDFDFAVDCAKPSLSLEREINEEIDRVSGLYKVDIVYLDSVDKEFKEIILKTGRVLYKSSKESDKNGKEA